MSFESWAVVGLGFGDEGKGTTVDALVRKTGAKMVIRFNGGPQAAHNVVTNEGKHHTFATWGSGTLAGAQTLLGPDVLVNPQNAFNEAQVLSRKITEPWIKLSVHADCRIITPCHVAANRARTTIDHHGSTGQGIGETVRDYLENPDCVLRMRDLTDEHLTRHKLQMIMQRFPYYGIPLEFIVGSYKRFAESVFTVHDLPEYVNESTSGGPVVYEGAQGVLLDESYGMHPHTTWSDCTFTGADKIHVSLGRDDHLARLGITRAYTTRHGYGPFPTEGSGKFPVDEHNKTGEYMGDWRVGALDLLLLEYAARAAKPDYIGVTCLDRVPMTEIPICDAYRRGRKWISHILPRGLPQSLDAQARLTHWLTKMGVQAYVTTASDQPSLMREIEHATSAPVVYESHGQRPVHKVWREDRLPVDKLAGV